MAYSSYKNLKKVVEKFGIKTEPGYIFSNEDIKLIEPSDWLKLSLQKAERLGFYSEKERSERLVHPVLAELVDIYDNQITLYSGQELNVNKDLTGECDYMLTLGRKVIDYVSSPLFSIVEAKRQDMEHGTAQCAAQLIGAKKYNENDGIELPYLYGATTDGQKWRFLRFKDNVVTVHDSYYFLDNLPTLLGVLSYLVEDCRSFKI
jgi:hypothetical protein